MDKADELFHEIVVEKSRSIYENLIAEEDDEEMEEGQDDEEEMDESAESDDEEMDESQEDLEDSYMMDADDGFGGGEEGDATDDLGAEIGMDADSEEGEEASEDEAMMDIKNAIEELEAAFAELEAAQGGEEADMGMDSEFGDEEDGEEDDMEMMGTMESRRITREYVEKVGNDWDKNSQKTQGQYLGANTGESMPAPTEGKSPISSGSGKPTSGANAKNLAQGDVEGTSNTGTSPAKVNKGINPESSEKFAKGIHNVDGTKSGVKTLSKVTQNSKTPGPVGSGTGDKAGQTSVSSDKPFLKKI
jgi:hypothetical protein